MRARRRGRRRLKTREGEAAVAAPRFSYWLQCWRCGRSTDPNVQCELKCKCGGPLAIRYPKRTNSLVTGSDASPAPLGVWRYSKRLPVGETSHWITLGEGGTPLVELGRVGRTLGLGELFIKNEAMNPTGTFKDRGAAVGVSCLSDLGYRKIVIPTAGSGGSAWSAYGARAGMEVVVTLPAQVAEYATPVVDSSLYGSSLDRAGDTVKATMDRARDIAQTDGAVFVGPFGDPFRLEGDKTIAFEIYEQMHGALPDWIVWPTGGAIGLVGIIKGIQELVDDRVYTGTLPGLVVVQMEGAAPLANAVRRGLAHCDYTSTIRTSVAPGITVDEIQFDDVVLSALAPWRTVGVEVSELRVLDMVRECAAREGLLLSGEGAAAMAGLASLCPSGQLGKSDTVVVVNTGSALRESELLRSCVE